MGAVIPQPDTVMPRPNADHEALLEFRVILKTNAPPEKHERVADNVERELRLQFGSHVEVHWTSTAIQRGQAR